MALSFFERLGGIPFRRPFARLTIAGKMLAGYAVLAALTFSVVIYVLVNLFRINYLNRIVVGVDIPIQVAIGKMVDAAYAQSLYEKRYLILRRKDFRHLYWERAREFDSLLGQLKSIKRGVPLPLARISRLHARHGDLFMTMTKRVREGKLDAAEALSNGAMKDVMDELTALLREIPSRAEASQNATMKEISRASGSTFRTTVLLCMISTVVGAAAGLWITRYISSSVRRLKSATARVAEGNFESGIQIESEDEIGDLARAFDVMGKRLKKTEEMYLDASPLTRLPGGIAIEREVQKRLDRRAHIAFCVMDIDNFKAFNDRYGYAHGNDVIKETARIVEEAARTHGAQGDFVGHIGGDDFVVVTSPDRMHELCGEIITQFDRRMPGFYGPEDRERGYIQGKTRQGADMKFPIMTISIAIITNMHRAISSPLEASELAAELKDYAKTFNRSLFVIDQRRV